MLTFTRYATRGQNAQMSGVICVHSWPTGSQELVFTSMSAAKEWATQNGLAFRN